MTRKRFIWCTMLSCISVFMLTSMSLIRETPSAFAYRADPPSQKDIDVLVSLLLTDARLIIPRIGVNAAIDTVDANPDGTMAVPTNQPWTQVGWYVNGPYPGELGSAVIDGHLDRPGGLPAVFWNLHLLRPGDLVLLETPGQPRLRFRVTSSAIYTPSQAPLKLIFNNTQGYFLNLITCIGRWMPSIHQTTHRLVVYTKLL